MANKHKDPLPSPLPKYRERETRRWTPDQRRGIETVGCSLLVSAAAGSGKTAMLAERCVHLVCDADDPCDVDELLVVTFTEAAATEMKSRIAEALRDRAARDPGGRAARQLKMIDAASIGTLHGFCSRVLRQHFHLVGLDPAFTVLDADEAKLLRAEVVRELFADRYELDDNGEFQRFIDDYGDGDDQRLARLVVRAHDTLTSLVDPAQWIREARHRLEQAARLPLDESKLGGELHDLIARELDALASRCTRAIEQVRALGGFDKYVAALREAEQVIKHWQHVFRESGLSALTEESQVEFERLPSVPNSVPHKAGAKAALDSVREPMKSGPWRDLLRFSPEQWTDGLRAILPHANVFLDLVQRFEERYSAEKASSRVLDFSDLERFTLAVLRDSGSAPALAPSPAARSLHKRFRHVLVDEYQDINEVQDAILSLVSLECVAGPRGRPRANLFCVGDVKQSIYRFRLAEAGRFLERQKQFRADGGKRLGDVIDLQKNFRSRAPLLAAINGVFARLMTLDAVDIDYDDSHKLHAGANYPPAGDACTFAGAPIEMHLLPAKLDANEPETQADCDETSDADLDRTEREAVLVARRIREMMGLDGNRPPMCVSVRGAGGELQTRPMQFRDVVILLRAMKFKADQYADVLRQHGIPVHSESGTGYFESTEVSDVLSLLSLLNNGRQDVALAALLRSPLAGLAEPENGLARIRLAYPREGGLAFHEAVAAYARERGDELAGQLRHVLAEMSRWRELAQRRPLADVITDVYQRSGHLAYCGGLPGGEQRVANLTYLLERARQFGTFHRQGLARFMQFIESLREQSDLGQPPVASQAQDVVRILSVHRAKGLEFPVVFLPDLGKTINFDDCNGSILLDRTSGLGMSVVDELKKVRYPSLALALVRARLRRATLAEEMRVLYVAMTRAREHLVLVGTCAADAEQQWRDGWGGYAGPFPTDMVLGASNMLAWLGPVAAAAGGAGEDVIRVQSHGVDEVAGWRIDGKRRHVLTPQQEKLARLEPLDPPPARSPAADDLIGRLTSTYPNEAFANLHAAEPMARRDPAHALSATLGEPRFMLETGASSPIDIGDATHLALQHLDFRRACDPDDLAKQLGELVARNLMAKTQADRVDLAAIEWLTGSEVGNLLREHAGIVRRELPVYLVDQPLPSADPQDQVMIRGRIDVLIPLPENSIVIDYKTDRFVADATKHSVQTAAYRRTVETITGKPVAQVLLVYLHARVIQTN